MFGRTGPRIALTGAALTLVVAVIGFVVAIVLNAFVFDDFDAYGELPIPGSGSVHLPAGEATVSFHTQVTGSTNGAFPVPPLQLSVTPRGGGPQPVVTESIGTTTSVNSDVRIRIWFVSIPRDGVYDIDTGGNVNGYINPQLAFGRDSSPSWPLWAFGGLFVVGLVALAVALTWSSRARNKPEPMPGPFILD
jgi:hypothetical protein